MEHWEEINELDALELTILCSQKTQEEEVHFLRLLITSILKKTQKLRSLKLRIKNPLLISERSPKFEPFLVKEVPHLYESLEKFEFSIENWICNDDSTKFDLRIMNPFSHLKEVRLESSGIFFENIEEAIHLLQENQKEGDYPTLKVKLKKMTDKDWLGETFKKIEEIKRMDKNLKIVFDLSFQIINHLELAGRLSKDTEIAKTIQGVETIWSIYDERDDTDEENETFDYLKYLI